MLKPAPSVSNLVTGQIWLGDSLQVNSQIARTVQTTYIDPPFGTGRMQRLQGRSYHDDVIEPETFCRWLKPYLAMSRDKLVDSGSLFVHLDYRAVHYCKVLLDSLFGRENFINEIIWCYSRGGKSDRSFGKKHDTILWYGKTRDYAFYPEAVKAPRKGGSHMRVVLDEQGQPVQEKTHRKTGRVYRYPLDQGKIPEDWWTDIESLNRSEKERVGWPSQKPLKLLDRMVLATSQPGQWIADWFAGSGTTAICAAQNARNFVVAERQPAAVELIEKRIEALRPLLKGRDCELVVSRQVPKSQGEIGGEMHEDQAVQGRHHVDHVEL